MSESEMVEISTMNWKWLFLQTHTFSKQPIQLLFALDPRFTPKAQATKKCEHRHKLEIDLK